MHGDDVHEAIHLHCEIHDPWDSQALGWGQFSHIVNMYMY